MSLLTWLTQTQYSLTRSCLGADKEEVNSEDVAKNTGKGKPVYKKIQLCGEQAKRDGLQCFLVDAFTLHGR